MRFYNGVDAEVKSKPYSMGCLSV